MIYKNRIILEKRIDINLFQDEKKDIQREKDEIERNRKIIEIRFIPKSKRFFSKNFQISEIC